MRARATIVPISAILLLTGCLAGERPRIATIYGDPVSQAPVVTGTATTTTTQMQQSVEVFTTPGTTLHYGPVYPDGAYAVDPFDRNFPVYRQRSTGPRLPSGEPRYSYPQNDLRCDNALRRCNRWSGQRGRYIPDAAASRIFYGTKPGRARVVIQP